MVAQDVAEFSWMWADAGGLFHKLSASNPWRWSKGSLDKILRELLAVPTWRPVELRFAGERALRLFGSPTEAARWLCERYVEVAVQLQVRHEVAEGEDVVVVGSAAELGSWDEVKAIRLRREAEDHSLWRTAELGGPGLLAGFDYRYGVTCNGTILWEEGPNRTVALGCGLEDLAAAMCVVLHGGGLGAAAQELQLLSRPLRVSGCSFPLASLGSQRQRERKRASTALQQAAVEAPLVRPRGPASFGAKCFPRMVWDHRLADGDLQIADRYLLGDALGEGKFGAVYRAELVHGGVPARTRAVKQVLKDRVESVADFNREVEVMVLMDHPNTLRLFEVFEDERYVHLVMELCAGGDMFDFMFNYRENGCPEPEAQQIFRQMTAAVQHCHSHNVAHRDLKLENFLLANAVSDANQQRPALKLCDMGLAARVPREGLTNCCGTPTTMAPEVLLSSRGHSYGLACDLWSLGSILYTLLSCMVAQGPTQSERQTGSTKWMTRLLKARYDLRGPPWPSLSNDSRDLVRSLMCKDPEKRLTAQGCLSHCWLLPQHAPDTGAQVSFCTAAVISQGLSRWFGEDRLGHFRKTALHVLAQQGGAEGRMLDAFRRLDTDGDGQVGLQQLVDAMAATLPEGEDNAAVKAWRERILPGMEEGATLGYTDFLAATMGEASWLEEDRCRDVFDFLDRDGDGAISLADLERIYPEALAKHAEEVANLGGHVTFERFVALMRASVRSPSPAVVT